MLYRCRLSPLGRARRVLKDVEALGEARVFKDVSRRGHVISVRWSWQRRFSVYARFYIELLDGFEEFPDQFLEY